MNWGHGVAIAFILFAGYILALVTGCLNQEIGLVAEDYYVQEVAYQSRINHLSNAEEMKNTIDVTRNETQVVIDFPLEWKPKLESGEVLFFRPSDNKLDLKLPLVLDENGQFRVNGENFKPGRYEVQLSWFVGEKGYYVKKDLFI